LIFSFVSSGSSQERPDKGSIRGRVVDKETNEPLIGANIVLLDTKLGASADRNGNFTINTVPQGEYILKASYISYKNKSIDNVQVKAGEITDLLIELEKTFLNIPSIVVTASKRTQSYSELPVSVAIISPREIQKMNPVKFNEILEYTPGVNIVQDQINIRGSGGYRMGTGSPVLVLLDGIPILAGDTGDIKWDIIPVYEIEQVEVIKGAGSALYGTAAMGGVINIITKQPSEIPRTNFRVSGGSYNKPIYNEWVWSEKPLTFYGTHLSHSRKVGKLDILLSGERKNTDGYHQNGESEIWSFFNKFRYNFSPGNHWTVFTSASTEDHGVFIQWKNANKPLEAPTGNEGEWTRSRKLNIASKYYKLIRRDLAFNIKSFYYKTSFMNVLTDSTTFSTAHRIGNEVQFDYFYKKSHMITYGAETIMDVVKSDLFGGSHYGFDGAFYVQDEINLPKNFRFTGGLRFDYKKIDSLKAETQLSPKIGLTYKSTDYVTFRLNAGKGFRYPLISEAFSNTVQSGFRILPNPQIRSESSWSYELGMNCFIEPFFQGDIAIFRSDYRDLIEANPDRQGSIRFENLTRARITGVEVNSLLATSQYFTVGFNYTYAKGEDLTIGWGEPLAYRPEHILNITSDFFYKRVKIGGNFRYISRVEKYKMFPDDRRVPAYLFDGWFEIDMNKFSLQWKVNNIFQYYYTKIERNLAPIRHFVLTLNGKF